MMNIFVMLMVFVSQNLFAAEGYSLEDLYSIALERTERIKISEEDLYISQRGKEKAFSVLLPKLSAFWDYTRYTEQKFSTGTANRFIIQPQYSSSWGVRLDQSISLSGREITAFKISKENIEKSKYDLYAVREEYLLEVSSAYYDVLRAKKAVDIAKASVERLTKHRDAAATRLKVGEVTKTALLRAEAELSGAQSETVKTENNLKLAKAVLARLVGFTEDYELKESQESSDLRILPPECGLLTVDCLKEMAMSERAELKAIGLQKKIAEEQVKFAQGAYWPTLSIEGVYSKWREKPFSPFFLDETIYGGFNLNFSFFEGGLRRAEVKESEARRRQAGLALEDLKKTVNIEVENAYLDFMTQKGVLKSLEDQLTFARDNYNAVSRQFEFGLSNSIDVMDANTLFVTAERQLADAKYYYQLSILKVERSTGTLLKTVVSRESGVGSRESRVR
jgi:outer membrane protein